MNNFCIHCGNKIENNEKYCGKCGKKPNCNNSENKNIFAIIGFILTIISSILLIVSVYTSVILPWIFAFLFSSAGLVFSIIGFLKSKKSNTYHKALAITGIIINTLLISISLLIITFITLYIMLY